MNDPASQQRADALGNYIQEQTGADAVRVVTYARLSGGAIQDNHALTVECAGGACPGRHEWVVRSDAPSQVAVSLTRAQEFRVLQVAFEAGVRVPQPLLLCEDAGVIGVPFCIMARVPGVAAGRKVVRAIEAPDQSRALVTDLGEQLARIHRIEPPNDRLAFLPMPAGLPSRARVVEYRAALDAIPEPHPVLEWALNWLEDHAPDSGLRTLCHGDFRTGNYLMHEGRVTAVLDWEFASWGDPFEDLGWLCARSWRFGVPEREVGGVGDKVDLYAAWEAGTGHRVDDAQVAYWEVMGMVRWAIIALQQAQRHLSGSQHSLELALTGRMVPEMELDILCRVHEIEGSLPAMQASFGRVDFVLGEGGGQCDFTAQDKRAFSAPDAADLLATARQTLFEDLFPLLPRERTYEALMIANAMAIARRELLDGGFSAAAARQATQAFLAGMEADVDFAEAPAGRAAASDAERTLAERLRARGVGPGHEAALRGLLMAQTRARLELSNPKYLATQPMAVDASSPETVGDLHGQASR